MTTASIIGSGPNGLAAAVRLAQAGLRPTVYESMPTLGGACSTGEVTLPGFHHDLGASAFPLGVASPFFNTLPLARHGLRWIEPAAPAAHPLDDGSAVMLEQSLAATCDGLDAADRLAYRQLLEPITRGDAWPRLLRDILGPIVHLPRNPLLLARFGVYALLPATMLARSAFKGQRARALFAGMAAHAVLPLTTPTTSAVALVLLAAGHTTGWPVAEGGAGAITQALARLLRELGGEIVTGRRIASLDELPAPSGPVLCDVAPAQLLTLAGDRLTPSYRRILSRFRHGPGSFKIDYALSEPIPWRARDCSRAATVHVGGTLDEIAASEAAPWQGIASPRPFCLVVQPSLFDPSRAPRERHTAWVYCHVPYGSTADQLGAIEAQLERFAPGFGECVIARGISAPAALAQWNANLAGGDLSGGAMTPQQLLLRPTLSPYRTSARNIFLCSASTPPGGGVHGMCGFHAAERALASLGKRMA